MQALLVLLGHDGSIFAFETCQSRLRSRNLELPSHLLFRGAVLVETSHRRPFIRVVARSVMFSRPGLQNGVDYRNSNRWGVIAVVEYQN
jgi:hypothetical protein